MKTIYLAGPIFGCTEQETKGWREQVKRLLPEYLFYDPTDLQFSGKLEEALRIVETDKSRIRHSTLLLAHCWRPSTGTAMEVLYAKTIGLPVIAIAPEPWSPWIFYHSNFITPSLEIATNHIRKEYPCTD